MTELNALLFFEKCSVKDNKSLGDCTGKFGKTGSEVVFNYSFQEDGEPHWEYMQHLRLQMLKNIMRA